MKEAIVETTTYNFSPVENKDQIWVSKWEVIKFPGFMKLYIEWNDEETEEEGPINLPALTKWEIIKSLELLSSQNFSKPPLRFTEAMLVKKLGKWRNMKTFYLCSTISTIIDRWYVKKLPKNLHQKIQRIYLEFLIL